MDKKFNQKSQQGSPHKHKIVGEKMKQAFKEKPYDKDKAGKLVDNMKAYDAKNKRLKEIKEKARSKYQKPTPQLTPKGTPPAKGTPDKQISRNEERLRKAQERLDKKYKGEAGKIVAKGKAKKAFNERQR